MNRMMRGLLVTALAFLAANGTAAWACDVQGQVVCASTGAAVPNVAVSLDVGWGTPFVAVTDANGFFSSHVWYVNSTYSVTLDLTGAGGTGTVVEAPVTCDAAGSAISIPAYAATVPGCSAAADCSPGYYKNHPEVWCDECLGGVGCTTALEQLSARGPGSDVIRGAVKAALDACFGTAEVSPCVDDNL